MKSLNLIPSEYSHVNVNDADVEYLKSKAQDYTDSKITWVDDVDGEIIGFVNYGDDVEQEIFARIK